MGRKMEGNWWNGIQVCDKACSAGSWLIGSPIALSPPNQSASNFDRVVLDYRAASVPIFSPKGSVEVARGALAAREAYCGSTVKITVEPIYGEITEGPALCLFSHRAPNSIATIPHLVPRPSACAPSLPSILTPSFR